MKLSTSISIASALACLALAPSAAVAQGGKALAYVTNQDGGIIVIDLETLSTIATINAEIKGPRGVGVTADGKWLVTANRDTSDLAIIDTAENKVVKHVPIGKNPEFVRVRGNYAFVTFEPSAKAGPPPKPGEAKPEDDDDDEAKEPAKIAVVDLKKAKVIRHVTAGPETEGIEFSPDGKHMLVTNEADNTVTVHSMATGKLIKTISTHKHGDRPRGVKVSPNGKHYVVTLEYGDKLMVMDRKYKVLKTVPTGKTPYGVAFDRSGKRLFVAASREKQLQVFDGETFEMVKAIPSGDRCWHFSFTPDDSKILLACGKSNEVLIYDANSYEQIGKIENLPMPWGVVTYPKAMGSLDTPK